MSKIGKICFLISGLSLIVLFTARLILGGWLDYLYFPLGLSALTFLAAFIVDFKFYLEFLTMRTTKHGMNMGAMILLGLALIVAVNFLGKRFDKTFDVTKEKINTLSDQTLTALNSLKSDLTILVFYRGSDEKDLRSQVKQNFQLYMDASPKVKIEFVDALLDVEKAKRYLSNNERFAVVLDHNNQRAVVEEPYNEEKTVAAISKVTREKPKSIYFLQGHGERDPDANNEDGMSMVAEALKNDGYEIAKLNLLTGDKTPEPPAVVAIVGPRSPLTDGELKSLREFARNGGRLLIAADPGERHNMTLLSKSIGFEFKNNYIVNQFEGLNDLGPLAALGAEYDRTNDITKKFYTLGQVMASVFMTASEVSQAPDAVGTLQFSQIVRSAPQAFTSHTPTAQGKAEKRSVTIGLSAKGQLGEVKEGESKKEFAAVIFGDSDFVSNRFVRFGANRDLMVNSLSYLSDDLNKISIRAKSHEQTPLEITSTRSIIIVTAGVGLPLLLIVLSGLFWFRRRNL